MNVISMLKPNLLNVTITKCNNVQIAMSRIGNS